MSGKGSGRRPLTVSQEQFASNWERVFDRTDDISAPDMFREVITKEQDVIIDVVSKGDMLREVAHDGMWQHSCTVDMTVVWIGKDETCNYCGAWEEDGQ